MWYNGLWKSFLRLDSVLFFLRKGRTRHRLMEETGCNIRPLCFWLKQSTWSREVLLDKQPTPLNTPLMRGRAQGDGSHNLVAPPPTSKCFRHQGRVKVDIKNHTWSFFAFQRWHLMVKKIIEEKRCTQQDAAQQRSLYQSCLWHADILGSAVLGCFWKQSCRSGGVARPPLPPEPQAALIILLPSTWAWADKYCSVNMSSLNNSSNVVQKWNKYVSFN